MEGLFRAAICAILVILCLSAADAARGRRKLLSSFSAKFEQVLNDRLESYQNEGENAVYKLKVDAILKRILQDADVAEMATPNGADPPVYPPMYPPPPSIPSISPPPTPFRRRPPPSPFPPTPIRTYDCVGDEGTAVFGAVLDRIDMSEVGDDAAVLQECKLKCDQYTQEGRYCEAVNTLTTKRCTLFSEIEGLMASSAIEGFSDSCYVLGSWPKS